MNFENTGRNNHIDIADDPPGRFQLTVSGDNNHIQIGKGCKFPKARLDVRGQGCRIEIGENCNLIGEFVILADHSRLVVGSATTSKGAKIMIHEPGSICIGQDCMFAGDVRMNTSDVHSVIDMASGKRINPPGDIQIGDHVWLAFGVIVGKGVTIGAGSVIGAMSMVTANVASNSLAVGVPARVIRSGIGWDRNRLPFDNAAPPNPVVDRLPPAQAPALPAQTETKRKSWWWK